MQQSFTDHSEKISGIVSCIKIQAERPLKYRKLQEERIQSKIKCNKSGYIGTNF